MTAPYRCTAAGLDLGDFQLEITPKKIKHIYFRVDPVLKKVRISIPFNLPSARLNQAILGKKNWLLKQMNNSGQRLFSGADDYLSLNPLSNHQQHQTIAPEFPLLR